MNAQKQFKSATANRQSFQPHISQSKRASLAAAITSFNWDDAVGFEKAYREFHGGSGGERTPPGTSGTVPANA